MFSAHGILENGGKVGTSRNVSHIISMEALSHTAALPLSLKSYPSCFRLLDTPRKYHRRQDYSACEYPGERDVTTAF